MLADHAIRALIAGLLVCGGMTVAAEEEEPDLDFLEYLGMWEGSDEEWQMFEETVAADNEERSDPVPEGEESTENEDES